MALASSGQLKFSELQTEFGGENPISFSEYYGGGTIIGLSAGNSGRVITNIPLTGRIKMSNFHGSAIGTAASSSADVTITMTPGSFYNTYGYDTTQSISSNNFGTLASGSTSYDGATIIELREFRTSDAKTSAVTGRGFRVGLSGTRSQGFFTSIDVGSQNLTSSSATHTQSGGNTTWVWAASSSYSTTLAAWTGGTGSTRTVDFNE